MAKYILKRLGYIIIVFFLLSILLFGIFKMVPGDTARLMVEGQKQSVSPEQYEMLYQQARVRLGLDKPERCILYFPFRNRNSAGNQMCGKKRHGV